MVAQGAKLADSLESKTFNDELLALFTPEGSIAFNSTAFEHWADESKTSYLRRRARDADAGVDRLGIEIRGGAEVRMTRLDGDDDVRYLVAIDRPELAKIRPKHRLTDRQQQVAEYAIAGATCREIADTLELSHHTVKQHIKNIYDRLSIGSRAELASMIGDE